MSERFEGRLITIRVIYKVLGAHSKINVYFRFIS
jgi:hypothetical protein